MKQEYTRRARDFPVWTPDRIKKLRKRYGENQEQFAKRFRVSIGAVRIWEQGQGEPSGPVTIILEQLEAAINAKERELQSA